MFSEPTCSLSSLQCTQAFYANPMMSGHTESYRTAQPTSRPVMLPNYIGLCGIVYQAEYQHCFSMYIVVWVESAGESSVLTLKALAWIMQYFPTLIKVGIKTRDRKRKKHEEGRMRDRKMYGRRSTMRREKQAQKIGQREDKTNTGKYNTVSSL